MKRKKNPQGDMPLVEHLKELRRRVIVALVAFVLGTIAGFIWYQNAFLSFPSLGEIMRGPYCSLPPQYRADFTADGECRLLATNPFEMFLLRLKVGALAGLVLSSPVWLSQIWGFITPGLHKNERRWTATFVTIAVTLFVAGAVLAYVVVDQGLFFLMTIGDETQVAALTGREYYNFVLALIVIFGVSFEVPLILTMLNVLGLLEYRQVRNKRRIIWVLVFALAAFFTPGGEPISMLILGTSVGILVEMALQFCKLNDKRRGVSIDDELADLDDEEPSQLDYQPTSVKDQPQTFDDVL